MEHNTTLASLYALRLALKNQPMEVDSEKRTSLLHHSINYDLDLAVSKYLYGFN